MIIVFLSDLRDVFCMMPNKPVKLIQIFDFKFESIMVFKKGIHKCVECEKKKKEDPGDMGLYGKCSAVEIRFEKAMYQEIINGVDFP